MCLVTPVPETTTHSDVITTTRSTIRSTVPVPEIQEPELPEIPEPEPEGMPNPDVDTLFPTGIGEGQSGSMYHKNIDGVMVLWCYGAMVLW